MSTFYGLNLGLVQYKYDLENNTLQANNCQVPWINLPKYVEISLCCTSQCPQRGDPSAFCCLSSHSPSSSPASAAIFGEIACPLLGRGVFTTFFLHSHNAQWLMVQKRFPSPALSQFQLTNRGTSVNYILLMQLLLWWSIPHIKQAF